MATVLHDFVNVNVFDVGIAGANSIERAFNVLVIGCGASKLKVIVHAIRIDLVDDHRRYSVGNSYVFARGGLLINIVAHERDKYRDNHRD